MITEQQARKTWDQITFPEKLRKHSEAVRKKALELADKLIEDGVKVDRSLVSVGALLHDTARVHDHAITHGLASYEKVKELGFPEEVALIARNHVWAGIEKQDAAKLGLPEDDFVPRTIEQKIVSYADNLVDGDKEVTFEIKIKEWEKAFGKDSMQVRMLKMQHEALENYIEEEDMRELDKSCGIPAIELMENAGKGIAEVVSRKQGKVLVFCGPGNNGGDGFVAARYLKEKEIETELVLFGAPKTDEARENLKKAQMSGIKMSMVINEEWMKKLTGDIVVDALLGTGISGEVREPIASAIRGLNGMSAYKISIDTPSGINTPLQVNSDLVICMHRIKKSVIGFKNLVIVDIGIAEG